VCVCSFSFTLVRTQIFRVHCLPSNTIDENTPKNSKAQYKYTGLWQYAVRRKSFAFERITENTVVVAST
jgi:hypothetical protein